MNNDPVKGRPWASFCMSTYKRPEFLRSQVSLLLQQTFTDFEIVIADNDPNASAKAVVDGFNDSRIKYQCNGENLGMVKSFNRSVDRAMGEYIVMVTDDDPVFFDLLEAFHKIIAAYPGYSFYGGLKRTYKKEGELERIGRDDFIREFLDLDKTSELVWSGCLLEREALLDIGKLPDYGSPHLVDHAMLAMVGAIGGGVVVNKMYSAIAYHQTNFSKSNFDYYYNSCAEFYRLMEGFIQQRPQYEENKKVINALLQIPGHSKLLENPAIFTDWFLFAPHCLRIVPPLNITTTEILQSCDIINKTLNSF